ncbi:MAG: hypothetical protein Kow0081_2600 [Candidatus Dojkabacteria bacterium]
MNKKIILGISFLIILALLLYYGLLVMTLPDEQSLIDYNKTTNYKEEADYSRENLGSITNTYSEGSKGLFNELNINGENLKTWQAYTDDVAGISFKHPTSWTVRVERNENCTYPGTKNYCIDIISPEKSTRVSLLIIDNKDTVIEESPRVFYSREDLLKSLLIRSNANLSFIRSWWVNAPSYGRLHNLAIDFIDEDILEYFDFSNEGYTFDGGRWYQKNEKAYYLSYVFEQNTAPTPEELKELETLKIMDQIISTLEIRFEANPFK